MRQLHRVLPVLAVAGLVLIAGLLYLTRPVPELQLSVRPQRTVYAPGEAVIFTVVLASIAEAPLVLEFSSRCLLSFVVLNEDDAVVYDSARHVLCADERTLLTLDPGESQEQDFAWTQLDDSGEQVVSGRAYRIQGGLRTAPTVLVFSYEAEVLIR